MSQTGWQVTATTIYCDAVDDEATLIVKYEDRSVVCTAYPRYGQPDKKLTSQMAEKSQKLGRHLKCEGPLCRRMITYRDRLLAEETEEGMGGK